MFIEKLSTRDVVRTLLIENHLRIDQVRTTCGCNSPDRLVDFAVCPESQRVEVLGSNKSLSGSVIVSGLPQISGDPKLQFSKLVIDLRGGHIHLEGSPIITFRVQVVALLH